MEYIPQFRICRSDIDYRDRPSSYGLIRDDEGRLLVCRTPQRFMLPGGGIDPGETAVEAMTREVLEETGLVVIRSGLLCRANQYVEKATGKPSVNKLGYFFTAVAEDRGLEPADADHECLWLPLDEAQKILSHEAHIWVVGRLEHAGDGDPDSEG
jgi:8-oxo-dGTP diphosphatase